MSTESIQDTIRQRFEAPLPEFYRRRIIFWCDEANEFEELFDQIELSDVKKVKLTGRNSFAVKKLLWKATISYTIPLHILSHRTTGSGTSGFSAKNTAPTTFPCSWERSMPKMIPSCARLSAATKNSLKTKKESSGSRNSDIFIVNRSFFAAM